jgi:1-aminocyclopropane-1-carboxylate deaminase/D-cysteine desulfhydrase-like pyridoxal-dependent ACC family enzyme
MHIHPFYFKSLHHPCFIHRDDLLGGIASGSKHRKYKPIFLSLKEKGIKTLIIPASLGSNHLLLSTLYAKWHQIPFIIVTKKPYGHPNLNTKLTLELAQDRIVYSDAVDCDVAKLQQDNPNHFVMPLGGSCELGALGASTLGQDIENFNKTKPVDALFLDAGTGLTAASVIAYLEKTDFLGKVFVIAMGPLDFEKILKEVKSWLNVSSSRIQYEIHKPSIGKSYGSKPAFLDTYAKAFYQQNGILLDPIYNAKLFYTAETIIQGFDLTKTSLIVHSGGDLSALDQL